jgi:hypothetical protein
LWRLSTLPIGGGRTVRARLDSESEPISVAVVIDGWRGNPEFRRFWASSLCSIPFKAYYWETPPLSRAVLDRPFECVFVESHNLESLAPDSEPFEEHFTADAAASGVATFESLRRDAVLVAPYPHAAQDSYTHLAAFMRKAPAVQIDQVWSAVAHAVESRLGERPIWLSTAGLGVSWLHIRVDSRPKYYQHKPYTTVDYWGKPH